MKIKDAIQWFKQSFQNELQQAVINTPYSTDLLCAIAYQETGFIWSRLINKVSISEIAKLCVGDIIDAPKRSAFPKTKAHLIAVNRGDEMFAIARKALMDMAQHITEYKKYLVNKDKFCHGYGIFQYDIQFFKQDPDYFLNKQWEDINVCFARCIAELKNAQGRQGWAGKATLTDREKVFVAIAYNKGRADLSLGFKQGHKSADGRYYGENIFDYMQIAQSVSFGNSPVAIVHPAPLPQPTPVLSNKKIYKVKNTASSLNLRSTPEKPAVKPNRNIIASLPGGHLLSWLSGSMHDQWLEVETSLNGAHFKGFVSTDYIVLVKDNTLLVPVLTPMPAPLNGLPAVYMPRKSGSITKRSEMANALSLNEPGQPSRPSSGLPAELSASLIEIINWLNVEKPGHKRYQPTNSATFCNIYAHDYCHLAGVYLPRVWWTQSAIQKLSIGQVVAPLLGDTIEEIRANNIYRWLKDFGMQFGWRQTGELAKLQDAANLGGVALIIARRKLEGRSGHVVMIAPETNSIRAKRDSNGNVLIPVQSQAGAVNYKFRVLNEWWKGEQFAEFSFWIHA